MRSVMAIGAVSVSVIAVSRVSSFRASSRAETFALESVTRKDLTRASICNASAKDAGVSVAIMNWRTGRKAITWALATNCVAVMVIVLVSVAGSR